MELKDIKVGDKVCTTEHTKVWEGEMTVVEIYHRDGLVSCVREEGKSRGAFRPEVLKPFHDSPVKAAIALLRSKRYTVQAPYWRSKAVKSVDGGGIIAFVDKGSVQVNFGASKVWLTFPDWDRITTVVEEAKAFAKEYS